MSADLCPATGRMHRGDWAECEHCGYPTPEDRAAVEDMEQGLCHCGEPILISEDGFTRDMCAHCDAVRCDAYPGACIKPRGETHGLQALRTGISAIEYALAHLQSGNAYSDRGSAEFHLEVGLAFLRGVVPGGSPPKLQINENGPIRAFLKAIWPMKRGPS